MGKQPIISMQMNNLIRAAKAYAELAEKRMEHEEWRTKTLQLAANFARAGNLKEAHRLDREVSNSSMIVFDFTDVMKNLIKAVKPFRSK